MNMLMTKTDYLNDDVLNNLSFSKFIKPEYFQNFFRIDLQGAKQITSTGLIEFFRGKNLNVQILIIKDTNIDDKFIDDFEELKALQNLNLINIENCDFITYKSLEKLISIKRKGIPIVVKHSQSLLTSRIIQKISEQKEYISRLNILDLSASNIDNSDLAVLSQNKEMIGITMINISKTRVTDEGIRTICKSVNLTNLVDLIIKDLKISIKSLRLIMTSMYLSPFFNLQGVFEIYVNDTRLSQLVHSDDIEILAKSPFLINMTRLNFSNLKNVKSSGLIKLATSPYVQNIRYIDVSNTEINDAGIMAIANSSYFISLIDINFRNTPKITPAAIVRKLFDLYFFQIYLCTTKKLSLKYRLDYRVLVDKSSTELIQNVYKCPYNAKWRSLMFINQQSTIINNTSFQQFFQMNLYLFNVRDVTFVNVPKLDHKMFKEFCKSKNMQSLKNLRVVDCPSITTESLKFLLTLKSFPMLDLNSFLKTNVLLINDTIMGLLAQQSQLLNSKKLKLQKLGEISIKLWEEFLKSPYLINIKFIDLSYAQINNQVINYFQQSHSLINLESLNINNCEKVTSEGLLEIIRENNFSVNFNILELVQALKEKDVSLYKEIGENSINFNYFLINEKKLRLKNQENLEYIFNNPHFINVKKLILENVNTEIFQKLLESNYLYSLQSLQLVGKKIDLKGEDICKIFDENSKKKYSYVLNPIEFISQFPSYIEINSDFVQGLSKSLHLWNVKQLQFNSINFNENDFKMLMSGQWSFNITDLIMEQQEYKENFFNALSQIQHRKYIQKLIVPQNINAKSIKSLVPSKLFIDTFDPIEMINKSKVILTNEILKELTTWNKMLNAESLVFPELQQQQIPTLNLKTLFEKDFCKSIRHIKLENIFVTEQGIVELLQAKDFKTVTRLEISDSNLPAFSEKVLKDFFTSKNVSIQFDYNYLLNRCSKNVTDAVLEAISNNIVVLQSLRNLVFRDNDQITSQGLLKLIRKEEIQKLKSLEIESQFIGGEFTDEMIKVSNHLKNLIKFVIITSKENFTSAHLINFIQRIDKLSNEFDLEGFIYKGFKNNLLNKEVLNQILTIDYFSNVTKLLLDDCKMLNSVDFRLIFERVDYQLQKMKSLKVISLKNTKLEDKDLQDFTKYPLFVQLENLYISGCLIKNNQTFLTFFKGIHFLLNKKFDIYHFFKDISGLKILDPKFFEKFTKTKYFKFYFTSIDVESVFQYIKEAEKNEITNIFINAKSYSFNITPFILALQPEQRKLVDDLAMKKITRNYRKKGFFPIRELVSIKTGINYLIQDLRYSEALKISYFITKDFQQVVSADSLKVISKIAQTYPNLFSVITRLDLSFNEYRTTFGLSQYVKNFVGPWVDVNQEFRKDQNRDGNDEIENLIFSADHFADDYQEENILNIIKVSPQLRVIALRENNVSDEFAMQLSFFLTQTDKHGQMTLPDLNLIDLRGNTRLSGVGLKFLYTSLVFRLNTNPNFQLLIGQMKSQEEQRVHTDTASVYSMSRDASSQQLSQEDSKSIIEEQKYEKQEFESDTLAHRSDQQKNQQKKDEIIFKNDQEEERKLLDSPFQEGIQTTNLRIYNEDDEKLKVEQIKNDIEKKNEHWFEFLEQCNETVEEDFVDFREDNNKNLHVFKLVDLRHIVQSIATRGIFRTFNELLFSKKSWALFWKQLIIVIIIFMPLIIFHLYRALLYELRVTIKNIKKKVTSSGDPKIGAGNNKIMPEKYREKRDQNNKSKKVQRIARFWCCKKKNQPYMIKKVPDGMKKLYFYFDEDIVMLNDILANSEEKLDNGRMIRENSIFRQFDTEEEQLIAIQDLRQKYYGKYVMKKLFYIYILNFFVYYSTTVAYQFVFPPNAAQCVGDVVSVFDDLPYYIYAFLATVLEVQMLREIHYIVGADGIFSFYSFGTLFLLYSSQMAKYDLYTDIQFVTRAYFCENLDALYISYVSMAILGINILFNWMYFFNILGKIWNLEKSENFHNTSMINRFAQLSFISEYGAMAQILDKFSTSSAFKLEGCFVPYSLQGLRFPQIVLSKLQRVFMEDLPQLGIQLYFTFGRETQRLVAFNQTNLIIFLTTILNMLNSLTEAWDAKPSKLSEKTIQLYSNFLRKNRSRWVFMIKNHGQRISFEKYLEIKNFEEELEEE